MVRVAVLLLVGLALGALAGCGGGAEAVQLTAADSGSTVSLEPGQEIEIRLDSNQTTGFRWNLTKEPETAVLELVGSEYEEPGGDVVGQGGTEVWTFRAVAAGSAALELGYFRTFEPENVEGTFTLDVDVS